MKKYNDMKRKVFIAGLLAIVGCFDGPVCLSRPTCRKVEERNRGSDESQEF